jgi:hypothetical protein
MSRIGVSCPDCGVQLRIESAIRTGSLAYSSALSMKCPKCSKWLHPPEPPERLYMLVDDEWIEQDLKRVSNTLMHHYPGVVSSTTLRPRPLLHFGLNLCAVMIHIKPRDSKDQDYSDGSNGDSDEDAKSAHKNLSAPG